MKACVTINPAGTRPGTMFPDKLLFSPGEVMDFQILLRGDEAVSVQCQLDLQNWRVDLFQAKYVLTQGRRRADEIPIDYRINISRPENCRGELAGRGDL